MKFIKLFEQHKSEEEIHRLCQRWDITNYVINPDMSIDVNGRVGFPEGVLTQLPLDFNRVTGNFICSRNYLTTLKGCPKFVGGNFFCTGNKLKTLEYSPIEVGGFFKCGGNYLTSTKGAPQKVGKEIHFVEYDGFPDEIAHFVKYSDDKNDVHLLFKYQEEYGIWNNDGSFNLARFEIFERNLTRGIL